VAALLLGACGEFRGVTKPDRPTVEFSSNVEAGQRDVAVDTIVKATAKHGTITGVELESDKGNIPFTGEGRSWTATQRLEPGVEYRLTATGKGDDGKAGSFERTFTTKALTLNEQTYPSVSPLAGETVGVGMPIIVRFDLPVQNRELFEQNMTVETSKPIEGRWAWFGDRSVHFRPKDYWPADTDVTVKILVNSLPAGNGIYGQQDQEVKFRIGSKVVGYVDVNRCTLTVKADDKVIRSIPVSTGDAKHKTRQGTKIIMEKLRKVDMDAATTGIDSEDPDYYDIEDVEFAMRLTNSGEFLHAAPWSVGSQGRANVSHGCTGMSTANAQWLYGQMKKGDPVEYTGSPRPIEEGNGWTDWNIAWDAWVARSALKTSPTPSPTPTPGTGSPGTGVPGSATPPSGGGTPNLTGIRTTAPPMPS
jgi:lipoprotein-anchoring transpeptidase ErfK/SrfK